MTALTLNKEYLNQLVTNKTVLISEQIYRSIAPDVFNAALVGKTSYTYDVLKNYANSNFPMHHPMYPTSRSNKSTSFTSDELPLINTPFIISNEDLVSNLQMKFPDCKVSYVGNTTMPDYTNNDTLAQATHASYQPGYVIPNGIIIDWS
jgi:hypothetical protein